MSGLLSPRRSIPRPFYWGSAVLGFVVLLCVWQWAAGYYAGQGKQVLFPSPAAVGQVMQNMVRGAATGQEPAARDFQNFATDLRISFFRVTAAFALAALTAIPLGVMIGSYRIGEAFIQPVTEFIRYIPVPALIPLLIVIFGIEETSKIMLIYLGTFFQLMLMVSDEIRRVPYDLVQAVYTMGGTRREAVTEVLLPASWPGIVDALRLCNGWAWSWLIVAELVAANEGMGFRIVKYQRFLQTDKIFFYLVALGVIGLMLDLAFRLFSKIAFRWNVAARN
ncbi:NitT/TauT family transport system permease protein [Terrimicrobium sacchariphilum]|uniref:NitT/TauT family transport system permease protein n=1 Tax=Terrimicrobium sacchariphilum TaxID=690879 RepID=A0A146G718_TERSA|nr:ABC transporter permease [Terrimicrobium sacchariphilum]GAT32714.1 NitT/TauT family transport system permease protein [Terrimicrobium sacchariphilum]